MRQRSGRSSFVLALTVSMLLHVIGLVVVPAPDRSAADAATQPMEVALVQRPRLVPEPPPPAPPPERRQMVAPPDEINDTPPERPSFESDRDNFVPQETVRRGVPNPAPPAPARRAEPQRREPARPAPQANTAKQATKGNPTREQPPRRGHAPALEDLFASTDELVRAQQGRGADQGEERPATKSGGTPSEERAGKRRRLASAIPPVEPAWSLPGTRGTLDHLPNIQRGNVTMLNTKANIFAPFVRRIGERVFQHLIIRQRRLELQQILAARGAVAMHVTLDAAGKLKSVRLQEQSGSALMDETLNGAVTTAAFDNNPPAAAANDAGEYEFIFQARLRAYRPGDGASTGRIESRLSIGLL